jgi:hypothetical protein
MVDVTGGSMRRLTLIGLSAALVVSACAAPEVAPSDEVGTAGTDLAGSAQATAHRDVDGTTDDGTTDDGTRDDGTTTTTSSSYAIVPDLGDEQTDKADPAGEGEYVEPPASEESGSDEPVVAEDAEYPGPVAVAVSDLETRLGIDETAITLVSFDAVVWPDGGLGCPQPGMAYTQVPVDGALIVLSVEGREFRYHSGGVRDPFLCLTG